MAYTFVSLVYPMGFVQINICGHQHRKKGCSTHLILQKAPEGKPVLFLFPLDIEHLAFDI
jgi:hypothetical protein